MKNNTYNFEKKQSVFGLLKMIISIYKVFDAGMIIISFALSVLFNIFLNNQYFKKSETWSKFFHYLICFVLDCKRHYIRLCKN